MLSMMQKEPIGSGFKGSGVTWKACLPVLNQALVDRADAVVLWLFRHLYVLDCGIRIDHDLGSGARGRGGLKPLVAILILH